jgi:hypothetical protein
MASSVFRLWAGACKTAPVLLGFRAGFGPNKLARFFGPGGELSPTLIDLSARTYIDRHRRWEIVRFCLCRRPPRPPAPLGERKRGGSCRAQLSAPTRFG